MIAISASGACRLPTWRCARPCWLRMNTSQRGHSFLSVILLSRLCSLDLGSRRLLRRIGVRRIAYPLPLFIGLHARAQALTVAGAVTGDHLIELVPVDLSEIVMPALRVPFEIRVGNGQAEILGLRH